MALKNIGILSLLMIPTLGFAFFCPNNFNVIDFGNTVEQVSSLCGKPDKIEVKEVKPEGPQEWSYFVPQTVTTQAMAPMQGTMKTQLTFDSSGRAVNMTVNGIGVGSTTICGPEISLGDTREMVKAACGEPSFINRQTGGSSALGAEGPSSKVTTFYYNTPKPTQLIFENGILKDRQ